MRFIVFLKLLNTHLRHFYCNTHIYPMHLSATQYVLFSILCIKAVQLLGVSIQKSIPYAHLMGSKMQSLNPQGGQQSINITQRDNPNLEWC